MELIVEIFTESTSDLSLATEQVRRGASQVLGNRDAPDENGNQIDVL